MIALFENLDPSSDERGAAPPALARKPASPRKPAKRASTKLELPKFEPIGEKSSDRSLTSLMSLRLEELVRHFHPEGPMEESLLSRMAHAVARLDLIKVSVEAHQRHAASLAGRDWDRDRVDAVRMLAAGLKKDPERVSPALQSTKHGAEWLVSQWEALARVLLFKGAWEEVHWSRAYDLLGVGHSMRGKSGWIPSESDRKTLRVRIEGEIVRLRERIKRQLIPADREAREEAIARAVEQHPAIANIERFESQAHLQLKRALQALSETRARARQQGKNPSTPPN